MSLPMELAMMAMVSEQAAGGAPASFPLNWVSSGSDGALYFNGAVGTGVTDSEYFDVFICLRSMEHISGVVRRFFANNGNRVDLSFGASRKMTVKLEAVSTGADLVAWTSTDDASIAGEFLFHIAADLSVATGPSFHVWKAERVAGVWGEWVELAGTFASGPTVGVIDSSRGFTNPDYTVMALDLAGTFTNFMDADIALFWYSDSAPIDNSDMLAGGVLGSPASVGAPNICLIGPMANITDDLGSANYAFALSGTEWADAA